MRSRLAPVLTLSCCLTLAATAVAAQVPDDWNRRLAAGEAPIEAHADGARRGMVKAAIDIDAPPAVIWRTILDCGRAARMTPGVKQCAVVSRAPDGAWEIREHRVKWSFFLPSLKSTARLVLEPDRAIGFTCIGGDIPACEGAWRLEPLGGGRRTRVTYEMWATAPFAVPAGLISGMMRRDVPQSLRALRRECEGK